MGPGIGGRTHLRFRTPRPLGQPGRRAANRGGIPTPDRCRRATASRITFATAGDRGLFPPAGLALGPALALGPGPAFTALLGLSAAAAAPFPARADAVF